MTKRKRPSAEGLSTSAAPPVKGPHGGNERVKPKAQHSNISRSNERPMKIVFTHLDPLHPPKTRQEHVAESSRAPRARQLLETITNGKPAKGTKQRESCLWDEYESWESSDRGRPGSPIALAWKVRMALNDGDVNRLRMAIRALADADLHGSDEEPLHLPLLNRSPHTAKSEQESAVSQLMSTVAQVMEYPVSCALTSLDPRTYTGMRKRHLEEQRRYHFPGEMDTSLRFWLGGCGTRLTIMDGEAPTWSYSIGHDASQYTILKVIGTPATLFLPTLGYTIPLSPGDIIGFVSAKLLWRLERSKEPEWKLEPMFVLMSWSATRDEETTLNEPTVSAVANGFDGNGPLLDPQPSLATMNSDSVQDLGASSNGTTRFTESNGVDQTRPLPVVDPLPVSVNPARTLESIDPVAKAEVDYELLGAFLRNAGRDAGLDGA